MSDNTVYVTHNKRVRVKYKDFDSLIQKTKVKLELSTDIRLEYEAEDGKWTAICDDEDLEDISPSTKLRLVLEENKKNESFDTGESDKGGRKRKRSQSISEEGDNVGGDKINATNAAKIAKVVGDVHIHDGGNTSGSISKVINPEEACKTYKQKLFEYAQGKAVNSNIYSGRKISIVKLQITSMEQQSRNKEGVHLHHREARAELMSRTIVGDVEIDKLFEKAKTLAEEKSSKMHISDNQNAQEKFIKKAGNLVIISGQAGSGKTTLSKTILGDVIGKERLFDIDIVLYLTLRDVDYQKQVGFLKFLAPTIRYDCNNQKAILDTINDSDKALIIMDGLDESNIDFTTSPQSVSIDDEATAEIFIKNLLNGSILPNAKKLIFSRPRTVADLPDQYKPILVATILGLNQDAQLQICNDICKENSEMVYQNIKNNPNLSAYCQTPLNLILAAHTINETSANNSSEIHTFTDVLIFTLQWFVDNKKHRRGNFDAKSIASLAWNGFKKDIFTFTPKDFNKNFNIDDFFIAINQTSKLTLLGGDPEINVFFSHLVLQELFAALHLLYFMELKEFLENRVDFISPKFEIVTKIMFGLCNEKTNNKVKEIISSESYSKEKIDFLKSFVDLKPYINIDDEVLRYFLWSYELNDDSFTQTLANYLSEEVNVRCRMLPSDFAAFHYVCGMRKQQSITFRRLTGSNFYGDCWHQFLSDKKLIQYLKKMEMLDFKRTEISYEGALALAQCRHKIHYFHLKKCSLTTIGWKTVLCGVSNMNNNMEITNQPSNENYIRATLVIEKNIIESFTLRRCSLTTIVWKMIFGVVAVLGEKTNKLNLEYNQINDEAAISLAQCRHNIQQLYLNHCGLTAIGWKTVFNGLANTSEKMNKLVLEHNEINDEAAISLAQCSHNIEHLSLTDCSLTAIGWKTVFNGLANTSEKMEITDQQSNQNYVKATLVIESNKIEDFTLWNCGLTTIEWKAVFSGVANLGEKMKKLVLEHNEINDEAAISLAQCSHNIEHLSLTDCSLTAIGWKTVFNGLANTNEKMESSDQQSNQNYVEATLRIENNKIEDFTLQSSSLTTIEWKTVFSGVANLGKKMNKLELKNNEFNLETEIASLFRNHNIQQLYSKNCSLMAIGWKTVFKELANTNEKMMWLELSNNEINDEVALALAQFTNFSFIQSLYLRKCRLTTFGWKTIFSGLANKNEKMKILELKENEISDEAAFTLVKNRSNVEQLYLNHCTLTAVGWKTIFSGHAKKNEKVKFVESSDQQSNQNYVKATLHIESNKIEYFTLQSCSLTTIEWKTVFSGVANLGKKMNKLELGYNEFNDEAAIALAQCSQNIEQLYLSDCSLTVLGWKTVFGGLANTNEKMETSDQQSNQNYVEATLRIENNKIEYFTLRNCSLTTIGWETVFIGVVNLNEKVNMLKLSNKEINDEIALALAQCSHNIPQLHLTDCSLTKLGWKTVFSGVANLNEKMKILILKENEMNDEVALALAQCSHNIEQLYLSDCSLTTIGWKTVFNGLAITNEKMETYDQQSNEIYVKGTVDFADNKVVAFRLPNCSLTTIKDKKKTELLEVAQQNFFDEAALALVQSRHSTQQISFDGCSLTTIGWKTVFHEVANLNEKVNMLKLENNKINDEIALALAQCSHNIQHLHLTDCSLTKLGWKTVFSGVANLNEKMDELIIKLNQDPSKAHCKSELSDELVKEYETRLKSKVTNLTINNNEWFPSDRYDGWDISDDYDSEDGYYRNF